MFKIDSHVKPPREKKAKAMPDNVRNAIGDHQAAFKLVFGTSPHYRYDNATKFIHVGNSAGVSLMRLKELTRQLNLRAGQ